METVINKEKVAGRYDAFNLASLLSSYPDDFFENELIEFLEQKELIEFCSEKTGETWKELKVFLDDLISGKNSFDDIRSDYIDIFDRGRSENSLYETEYGRERVMAKTNELADLSGFYNAFGLDTNSDDIVHEMPDHVSLELEFYGYLFYKQAFMEQNQLNEGVEVVLDARKKFLDDHLGRFVKSITQRPGVTPNDFFSKVFNWIDSLIDNECMELEVKPIIVEWVSSQVEPEAVECAMANNNLAGAKMTN